MLCRHRLDAAQSAVAHADAGARNSSMIAASSIIVASLAG
jgi:hypothetical protein